MLRPTRSFAAALTVLSLALSSVPAVFAGTSSSDNRGKIDNFYVNKDGRIFIRLVNPGPKPADCLGGFYFVPANHPYHGRVLDSILTAWSTDATVGLRVIDAHQANTHCEVTFVLVDR